MTRSKIRILAVVAAFVATAACREAADPPDTSPNLAREAAVLSVDSQYQGPVTVYVQRGDNGPTQRLGTITFGSEERYTLRTELLAGAGGLRFEARVIGSGESVITEPLHVEEGATVHWTLLDPLEYSLASVRVELSRTP